MSETTRRRIAADLKGLSLGPLSWSWDARRAILYALGVGARPDRDLDFLYEARGPKVLPTYGVIPAMLLLEQLLERVQAPLQGLLHGEQALLLHRPFPPAGLASVAGRVSEVWDKGKAAVIAVEARLADAAGPLCDTKGTFFVRGAGGFGGPRGPATETAEPAPPQRPADFVAEEDTRPEQAALYRLSGGASPLHIDPEFAAQAGYPQPTLHGLATYGFVGRALLAALCGGDPARLVALAGRFSDVVYPGEKLIIRIWLTGPGNAVLQAETQDGRIVFARGAARFRT